MVRFNPPDAGGGIRGMVFGTRFGIEIGFDWVCFGFVLLVCNS
jgi:hypothetical protein